MAQKQLIFYSHRDTFPVIEIYMGETVDHLKKDPSLASCDDSQEVKREGWRDVQGLKVPNALAEDLDSISSARMVGHTASITQAYGI